MCAPETQAYLYSRCGWRAWRAAARGAARARARCGARTGTARSAAARPARPTSPPARPPRRSATAARACTRPASCPRCDHNHTHTALVRQSPRYNLTGGDVGLEPTETTSPQGNQMHQQKAIPGTMTYLGPPNVCGRLDPFDVPFLLRKITCETNPP